VVSELVMPTRWSAPASSEHPKLGEIRELCAACGLVLDPWEWMPFERSLGVRAGGKLAVLSVGLCVPRQNGKGAILEARELAGMFVLGESLIHSAHQFDTSMVHFERMLDRLEEGGLVNELRGGKRGIQRSHGSEGFVLKDGRRLRFRTRTKGGGRGFTADCVVFDEAMILPEAFVSAAGPVISGRTQEGSPQLWYAGSAVDQMHHEDGVVFSRLRATGLRGDDDSVAWFEWSGSDDPEMTPGKAEEAGILEDVSAWQQANPGMGIRISEEYVGKELAILGPRGFAVERLGIGDWPPVDSFGGGIIQLDDWLKLAEPTSRIAGNLVLAFDVSPNRSTACIAAAGRRDDDRLHVEVIDHRSGIGWVVPRLVELVGRHQPATVVCDGPARSLVAALESEGVRVHQTTGPEYAEACGLFVDAVAEGDIRHMGTSELLSAIRGADSKPLGDAWKWSRRASTADITPLVSVTIAFWAAKQRGGTDVVFDWDKIAAA
jgi:hypothetical protein